MMSRKALIDTGILVAFYDAADPHHQQVSKFLSDFRGELTTTISCITETMWLLAADYRVQNEFLQHLSIQVYRCETLNLKDFNRITELNTQYSDLPGDFADLSLVCISERLGISAIVTLDSDFDIYRRYRNQPFERIFYQNDRT
jgi:uncharacterized protein